MSSAFPPVLIRLPARPVILRLLALLVAVAACQPAGGGGGAEGAARPTPGPAEPAEVIRLFDGDTLRVRWRGREETVRLVGIDAPEMGRGGRAEAGASAAAARARAWLEGRRIVLVLDAANEETSHRDRYDRLLAYVVDEAGEDLGRLLLAEGHARLFRKFDFARRTQYLEAQAEARQARRGLWAGGADAELEALAGRDAAAITLFATGGDLWAICLSGWVRLEVRPGELPGLLHRLRTLQLARRGEALRAALAEEGFRPAPAHCPAP